MYIYIFRFFSQSTFSPSTVYSRSDVFAALLATPRKFNIFYKTALYFRCAQVVYCQPSPLAVFFYFIANFDDGV